MLRDVLIDVRCLQDAEWAQAAAGRQALALLREARAGLPGALLTGLVDPRLAVPKQVGALLDAVRTTAYTGEMRRPVAFVQLAPYACDPLPTARPVLHPAIPALTVQAEPAPPAAGWPDRVQDGVRRYWVGRYHRALPPDGAFWGTVAALAPLAAPAAIRGKRAVVALIGSAPDRLLCAGLRTRVELDVFAPGRGLAALPLLSPRFDRVVSLVGNSPAHAPVLDSVARFGGAAVVRDSCLLSAYAGRDETVQTLAAGELGRSVSSDEIGRWRRGEIRAPALLGEVAAAAEPLLVHSEALARRVRERHGREAAVLPRPMAAGRSPARTGPEVTIAAYADGLAAEACLWALETLRFWGMRARMRLLTAPAGPGLAALSRELGLTDDVSVARDAGEAHVCAFLSMRGQGSGTGALAAALGRGVPCVASAWIAESLELPAWARAVPDEPSPPLIAEALLAALAAAPGPEQLREFQRRHDPERCARLLCEAMGIGA